MFGACDAAQEPIAGGPGGFLLSTSAKQRLGSVVHIDNSVMTLWPEHDVVIAQLELSMILQAGSWRNVFIRHQFWLFIPIVELCTCLDLEYL